MADFMEDDDMIVIIVEHDKVPLTDKKEIIPCPCPVIPKQEPLLSEEEPAVDSLLQEELSIEFVQEADTDDEYINSKVLKKEYDSDYSDVLKKEDDSDHSDVLEKEDDSDHSDVLEKEDDSDPLKLKSDPEDQGYIPGENGFRQKLHRKRTSILDKRQYKSFVQQLCTGHPELKQDPKLLLDRLTSEMKNLKHLAPPPNFYKIVYDDQNSSKYVCCTCQANRASLTSVTRHYQEKHGKRYLICFACGADFRRTTNLYKHEMRCSAPDARLVLEARGRFLGRKGSRSRPFITMDKFTNPRPDGASRPKDKRHYCSTCPESFVLKQNLIAHENSHVGSKPFQCSNCHAAYTSYAGLKRHQRGHTAPSVFMCDHCGRTLQSRSALVTHLHSHSPLPRFGCKQCGRRFAQKNALIHHINIQHLNLPPAHGCPICPKRYARMSQVKDHLKKAHDLDMVTQKKCHSRRPIITNFDVDEATTVLDSKINKLNILQASILEEVERKPKKNLDEKCTKKPELHNLEPAKEQKVYTIVLDD